MKISKEDLELFGLIALGNGGNERAKWAIIWKYNDLITNKSKINGQYSQECQEYIEMAVFKSIEKFKTLRNLKNN